LIGGHVNVCYVLLLYFSKNTVAKRDMFPNGARTAFSRPLCWTHGRLTVTSWPRRLWEWGALPPQPGLISPAHCYSSPPCLCSPFPSAWCSLPFLAEKLEHIHLSRPDPAQQPCLSGSFSGGPWATLTSRSTIIWKPVCLCTCARGFLGCSHVLTLSVHMHVHVGEGGHAGMPVVLSLHRS